MTVTTLPPAGGDHDPFLWLRLDAGEFHPHFCPDQAACSGACRLVVDLDDATVTVEQPADAVQSTFTIATAAGVVTLPPATAVAIAHLALAKLDPAGMPAPGMRRPT
jgi:hypothetical protein